MTEEKDKAAAGGSDALGRVGLWTTEHPAQAIFVLTATIYAALWVPTFIFYSRLGVTQDEVGLGVDTLIRASLGVLLVFLAAGILFGMALNLLMTQVMIQVAVFTALWPEFRRSLRLRVWGVVWLVAWIGTPVVLVLAMQNLLPSIAVPAVVAFDILGIGVLPHAMIRRWQPEVWNKRAMPVLAYSRFVKYRFAVWGVIYWSAPTLLMILTVLAIATADQVRDGKSVDSWILPWHAVPVMVSWTSPTNSAALPSCHGLRYLGTAESRVVLYDARTHVVYRLPASGVTVVTGSKAC